MLKTDEAIKRFGENEERVDSFVNEYGHYETNRNPSEQVETLPSFISRKDKEISQRYGAINSRGDWATSTKYVLNDLVKNSQVTYICIAEHTSTNFSTDLNEKKWAVYQGVTKQDLSAKDGAELIGYTKHTLTQTVKSKLSEVVSICDFGGADDWNGATGSNNFPAFSTIIDLYPNGATIRLPKKGSGIYNIVGDRYVDQIVKFLFVPDDGVSIRFVGNYAPLALITTTRKLKIEYVNQKYTMIYESDFENPVSSKMFFMNPSDGELPTFESVDQTKNKNYYVEWPNGPVASNTPSAVTEEKVTWNTVGATNFYLSTSSIKVKNELSGYFESGSFGGSLIAGVITTTGFAIIRQDATGGNLILSVKSGSTAIVETSVKPVSLQSSYKFANSLVSIKVNSPKSFSVLTNGIEIVNCQDTGGLIVEAGLGTGFGQNASACSVAGMYVSKKPREQGVKPLKIITCGDSITAGRYNWPTYFRQIIAGCGGVQVLDLKNLAVSGATSANQSNTLLSTNIAGYDYCLIQVGVNDVQSGQSVSGLVANVTTMVNYCINNNVIPIVGIPTMWYTPTESSGGVSSSNSEKGSPYRSALIRYLAKNKIATNYLTLKDYGAVTPALFGEFTDPIVYDNIHPNPFGSKLLAYAWAKTLIGFIFKKADEVFKEDLLPSSWISANFGQTSKPTMVVAWNTVTLGAVLSCHIDPIVNGTTVITLPENLRPAVKMTFFAPTANYTGQPSGYCLMIVDLDGTMKVFNVGAGVSFIYFGFSFPIF